MKEPDHQSVAERMDRLIQQWEEEADRRAIFLHCYLLMSRNVIAALEAGEFSDHIWVRGLLDRFAAYYFEALEAYSGRRSTTPAVWQVTHDAALEADKHVLQHMLLGINAHINYDLVLALRDRLQPTWADLSRAERRARYADHRRINEVIGRTVDTVQDRVVEHLSPKMDLVDKAFLRADEWLASRLLTHWREEVWDNGVALIEAPASREREKLRRKVEETTLQRADAILCRGNPFGFKHLI